MTRYTNLNLGATDMRLRDALKNEEQSQREGIGADGDMDTGEALVNDGGKGNIWPYIRESRQRLVRTEDKVTIILKLQLLLLSAIIGGIGVGLVMAFATGA